MCVQIFNDSRGLVIHIRYHIPLRSSWLWEPRHPLLKNVCISNHPSLEIQSNGRAEIHIHRDPGSLCSNDPSAGSPTETLLRLLLPLNDKV